MAIMESSLQSVLLLSHLPTLPGLARHPGLARIELEQGAVRSCLISGQSGAVLLQGQDAYAVLSRCGDLEWRVIRPPDVMEAVRVRPVTGMLERTQWGIPRLRVAFLHREMLASFPRSQRVALALVDGRRSVEEIAYLLSKSPREIQQMLAEIGHLVQL